MKAAKIFVEALENEGVEYVFAVPGEENLDLIDAIRESSIQLVVNRHEQGAGFMAATYGRLTGRTGVCLSTLGPGATNLVTAAAYAQLGAMPMLMITGQKPIKKSKQGKFQIINVVEMMRPLTKFTKQIINAHTIPALVREAFRLSLEERPGAVHLELPEDIAREEENDVHLFEITQPELPTASEESVAAAAAMIHKAKHPLLLIGAGANRKRTSKALELFIDKTQIPFFDTQMGKGVVDERHPLFMGTAALSANDYLHCAIARSDLIINVGHDVIEKPPFIMSEGGSKVIHVNFFSAHIDEVYFPHLEVIGDIAHSVEALTDTVEKHDWDLSYYHRVKDEVENNIKEGIHDDRFPIFPPRLVHDLRAVMPEEGIIALDNGMYKLWFARNYKAYQPNTVLLDNALATMGAGLPSAMAAKMVYPDRPVVCIAGDGGFMMNSHELETAVRLKLHLTVVILRDNAYGMIKWKQESMGLADFGLDFGNPDFVALAESYGAVGHCVKSADDFKKVMNDCLSEPALHVVDLPVDYSENVRMLDTDLKAKTCLI